MDCPDSTSPEPTRSDSIWPDYSSQTIAPPANLAALALNDSDRHELSQAIDRLAAGPDPDAPLVEVTAMACLASYHAVGWPGTTTTTWLRAAVIDRLAAIDRSLPAGWGLAIFDGWRSRVTISALWDHYYFPGSMLEPGYLADPTSPHTPPHLTGGAVDLTLAWNGQALALGTPFDEFSPRAHLWALEDDLAAGPSRPLRRTLHDLMAAAGFCPFAEEWWHYSWGDEDWCDSRGWTGPAFGATQPGQPRI